MRHFFLLTTLCVFLLSCNEKEFNLRVIADSSRRVNVDFNLFINDSLVWEDILPKSKVRPNYLVKNLLFKSNIIKLRLLDLKNGVQVSDSLNLGVNDKKTIILDFNSIIVNKKVVNERGDTSFLYKKDTVGIYIYDAKMGSDTL